MKLRFDTCSIFCGLCAAASVFEGFIWWQEYEKFYAEKRGK